MKSSKKLLTLMMILMLGCLGFMVMGCDAPDAPDAPAPEEPVDPEPEPEPEPAPVDEIDLGFVQWACAEASTHLAQAVIEDKLGYDVSVTALEAAGMYSGIAEGDLDAQTTAWLPVTHADYMDQYGDQLDDYGPMYEGARIGLVVPAYVDIDSIEELDAHADQFDGRIVGIDAGAGIMRATETALEEYGMDNIELLESSDAAMTAALADAYVNEEWVVVTGWSPHWKFADYDLKYLEDPQEIYGGEETINVIARVGLDEDAPDVADFLKNFYLEDEQLGWIIGAIADGQAPLDAARQWISENEDVVDGWL